MTRAISASSAWLRKSAAVSPAWLIRMSSGPSLLNEKPRSALVELHRADTPISSVTPSTGARSRSASASVHLAEALVDQDQLPVVGGVRDERRPVARSHRDRGRRQSLVPPPPRAGRGCSRLLRRCRRRGFRRAATARPATTSSSSTGRCGAGATAAALMTSRPAPRAGSARCPSCPRECWGRPGTAWGSRSGRSRRRR